MMTAAACLADGGPAITSEHRSDGTRTGQPVIRVVVAEDSYLIREILATRRTGAPEIELLEVSSDGDELRQAIATWHPDVVITDIPMPPSGDNEGIRIATNLREPIPGPE